MPIGPARMPLFDHLGELRMRLVRIVACLAVAVVVFYMATPTIGQFLLMPIAEFLPNVDANGFAPDDRHRPLRGVLRCASKISLWAGIVATVPRHPVAAARVLPAGAEAQRAQVVHAHLRRRRGPVHHRHGVLLPHHLEPGVPVAHRPGHGPRLCGCRA